MKMMSKCVKFDELSPLNVLGDEIRFALTGAETAGNMTVAQQRSMPGSGIPLHVHTREDEVFQVLEGRVEFHVGTQTWVVDAGTLVFAPKHLPHGFRVVGSEPALIQVTATPAGLEDMIREVKSLSAPPLRLSVESICQRYGITFLNESQTVHAGHAN